jgi:membrane fusion protein, copper/silver efflux system
MNIQKKTWLIVGLAIAAVVVIASALYFFHGGTRQFVQEKILPQKAPAAQATGHEGHSPGAAQAPPQPAGAPTEQSQETPTLEISPEKQQLIGVKTAVVKSQFLQKMIRTVGRVDYDERKLVTVNTKIEGWIERLHVDYTGKYVRKGEPLAEIYSPELLSTQREFLNVLKWSRQAKKGNVDPMVVSDSEAIVEAARQRLKLWDISDEQIRRIEVSGTTVRTLTIYSPATGYVVQKMALQGARVMPGEKLFDVADLSFVWIIADIYEQDLPLVGVNQTAIISLNYFPGREFASRIDYIYPSLGGDTRTAKVRFTIPNPEGKLKPQMFANVEIKIPLGRKLAIPDAAVIDTGTRQVVYVDKGDGYFEPREVILGIRTEGLREVIKGLKDGEKIAASAAFLIDSEAQLKGVKPLKGPGR